MPKTTTPSATAASSSSMVG